jgi:hypothetical protein
VSDLDASRRARMRRVSVAQEVMRYNYRVASTMRVAADAT